LIESVNTFVELSVREFIKPHKHIYNACSYWNSSVVAGCQKRRPSSWLVDWL